MPELVFAPFLPEHLRRPELADTRYAEQLGDPRVAAAIVIPGLSWSGFVGDCLIGCAGILPIWPGVGGVGGRASAWAVLAGVPRRCWPAITGKVHEICNDAQSMGWRRVETTVLDGFDAGARWAKRCGFEREGLMPGYGPDGSDHWMYGRVRR